VTVAGGTAVPGGAAVTVSRGTPGAALRGTAAVTVSRDAPGAALRGTAAVTVSRDPPGAALRGTAAVTVSCDAPGGVVPGGAAAPEAARASLFPRGRPDTRAGATTPVPRVAVDPEAAANALGRVLAGLDRAALPGDVREALADAEQLLVLARRVHNDAVRDTLGLRSRRLVRWLRLAGTAPKPAYFEIADPHRR
jgi:hypothetical protein